MGGVMFGSGNPGALTHGLPGGGTAGDALFRKGDGQYESEWRQIQASDIKDISYTIYRRPHELGLTNGSATLAGVWDALPLYSIFIGLSEDFSSGQTPVTYCIVEMIKAWSDGRGIIRAYNSGGAEWEGGISDQVPDGNWYRQFSTEDFQSGTLNTTVPAHSYKDYTITFPRAFAHAPKVWFAFYTTTTSASGGANMQISKIASATTTQQKVRVFNNDSSERSPAIHWYALDTSNGNR